MRNIILFLALFTLVSLSACGSEGLAVEEIDAQGSVSENPFLDMDVGDDLLWGTFIRAPYITTAVRELPIPIYLAFFNPEEEAAIQEGIDLANDAVGQEIFVIDPEWSPASRIIYKVSSIFFDDSRYDVGNMNTVIGYTYSRNIYLPDKYDAGRIVTDWAMELREGFINKFVVAHELGHAMGIKSHSLINYETDSLEDLEDNSLMAATIGRNPTLTDYRLMMRKQGEMLLDHVDQNQ